MNSIFKTDFYKCCHMLQYREDITHFTSYLTPRKSRFSSIDKVAVFGIANFVYKYLVNDFNKNFFEQPAMFISDEIKWVLTRGLNYPEDLVEKTRKKILALHKLGYLPIQILGLPEGTVCPMQVPAIAISSTNVDFAWVAQVIESLLSCEIWHPMISATIALEYKKIAKAAFEKTVDDNISHMTAMCDFSMRGQESYDSAIASGAAFLTSFYNCSTVEVAEYVDTNYNDDHFVRINGLTSTEHSVMCSDYAITGDERETYRRLLTEVYPKVSFAAVCDSYDFWNVVTNILPSLRKEIEMHEGFLGVRHDCYTETAQLLTQKGWTYIKDITLNDKVAQFDNGRISFTNPLKIINEPYKGEMYRFYNDKYNINTMVTPNHRMVRYNKKKNIYQVITADKMCYYDNMGLPRNGLLRGEISELTPLEKLFIAYQADGYCTESCLNKTEQLDRGYTIKFQFSKERKIKHLLEICREGNFEHWVTEGCRPHKNSQKDETTINVKIFNKPIKRFEDWIDLTDKNEQWCKAFIEEISYWDCRIRKDIPYVYEYINTYIKDAEIVQAIGALAGYNTHFSIREDNRKKHYKDCCYLTINKDKNIPCYTVHKEKIEDYNGSIYCINVPSGQLVVRDNNQIFISGNSSEPVHALCGIAELHLSDTVDLNNGEDFIEYIYNYINEDCSYSSIEEPLTLYIVYTNEKTNGTIDGVFELEPEYLNERGAYTDQKYWFVDRINIHKLRDTRTWEDKGMVEALYELFGGTYNSKGYKVINPKLKAVYGDSITIPRAKEIYSRLEAKGFAANNVSLGVGSFSMQCLEENGELKPFTRDSFSIAIKATFGQKLNEDGNTYDSFPIVKHPKGCSGKNSLSGLCFPMKDNEGNLYVEQNVPIIEEAKVCAESEFIPYFSNGEEYQYSFEEIRNRMEDNCK